jgi:hypothetical protein
LGILKATKKASVASPAPKKAATTMSLMKPNIRDSMVASPTTPAALAIFEFSLTFRGISSITRIMCASVQIFEKINK